MFDDQVELGNSYSDTSLKR